MKKNPVSPADAAELRRRAEERLKKRKGGQVGKGATPLLVEDTQRLIQELQIHQIELELQNEELKTSRAEVEAGLALYAELYDFAPVSYFTLGRDGTIRRVNLTGARLLDMEREQLIGRRFGLFVFEEDRPAFNAFLEKLFANRTNETCEAALHKEEKYPPSPERSGNWRFGETGQIIVHIEAIASEDGQECRAVMSDITERKQVEKALLIKTMLLEAQSETSIDGILAVDNEGRSILFNKRFGELWKIPQHILDTKDDAVMLECVLKQLKDPDEFGRKVAYLYEHRAEQSREEIEFADGRYLDRYSSPLLSTNGQHLGRIWFFRDITDRKRAEEALRESEALFRKLFEDHAAVKLIIDPDTGSLIDANEAAAQYYGWSRERLKAMKITEINTLAPEEVKKEMEKARANKRIHFEFRHRLADGSIRDVEVFSSKIEVKGKDFLHSIIHDITDRKRVEDELLNTLKQLQDSKDMLVQSEKLSAIGQLSAGVAHEILNPINIMGMKLQMLEMTETLSEKTKEAIRTCENQIKRVTKITRDLQQFARVSEKQITPSNINELIEQVFSLMGPRLKTEDVKVDARYQADLPLVPLDWDRMGQVILNLINNALDAMNGRPERVLRVTTELTDKNVVRLSFSDTGKGIPPEIHNRIFDPFFTTKEAGKGTGLGLSISYGIIQDHNGIIWAENNDEGGATFFIELPVEESAKT